MQVIRILKNLINPFGKKSFISNLPNNALILDVGCGNNSPYVTKSILPDCIYTGLDIGDYNINKPNLADKYILTDPENFNYEILKFENYFDAIICAHNLEHCNNRMGVLGAMLRALKPGGLIYLSFPCEESERFPSRSGTLNYYDDPTHKFTPPSFNETLDLVMNNNFKIIFSQKNYQPKVLWFIGWLTEFYSKYTKKIIIGTWYYWGFETIIVAQKKSNDLSQLS
jgi:SAM-dependent methyltransferase